MSNVPGFEFLGDAFLKDAKAKGVKMETSTSFLV
jgi:hypothetical protein